VLERLESGRLKVYKTCTKWLDEFRSYRYDYDEKTGEFGKIIKINDHIMDACRYAVMELKAAKSPAYAAPVRINTPGVRR
jgi:phage terminase large subunit